MADEQTRTSETRLAEASRAVQGGDVARASSLREALIAEREAAAGYSLRNLTTMSALHLRILVMTLVYSCCPTPDRALPWARSPLSLAWTPA